MKEGMMLWRERLSTYWNEASRYLKLIFNSGFLFTVYILFILGSYYYSQLLEWLPETFPAVGLFTVIFTWLLTRSRVRTFVKPADIVFLLPLESRLDNYFRASRIYSYVLQSFVLFFVMIILGPLFFLRIGEDPSAFWFSMLGLLLVKAWNISANWSEMRFSSQQELSLHFVLRGVLNGFFAYLLFSGAHIALVGTLLVIMVGLLVLYYQPVSNKRSLKWDHLINVEQQMLMFFYRIANLFTDVPQLRKQIRERRYLNWVLSSLSASRQSIYHYLFARSFIRANDYFGIYVRLVIVSVILVMFLPNGWLQLIVGLLFLHMVIMQLSTLWYHYDTVIWVDLYPVKPESKKDALTSLSLRLLLLMTTAHVIMLLITSDVIIALMVLVFGSVFSYYGSTRLLHKRKKGVM
ncbi:ABC transporter permease [Bacillus solitudinis]|uniref:ABC transporter permease n=1 Tax=Bacillus solitudinis TaxID=2014074 RepID=UPI000C246BCB|nr:ABC transporter permease [Bacillus solitudinis]